MDTNVYRLQIGLTMVSSCFSTGGTPAMAPLTGLGSASHFETSPFDRLRHRSEPIRTHQNLRLERQMCVKDKQYEWLQEMFSKQQVGSLCYFFVAANMLEQNAWMLRTSPEENGKRVSKGAQRNTGFICTSHIPKAACNIAPKIQKLSSHAVKMALDKPNKPSKTSK